MDKLNWNEFNKIIEQEQITKLYHFTDRDNLESIIRNGGLYSWNSCNRKNITINKPGGGELSRNLDSRAGLQDYARVSFTGNHPMMYVAMSDGRISNPVILEIDPRVIYLQGTKYADRNATKNGALIGGELEDFKRIHFDSVKKNKHFDLEEEEQHFFQAEVLVKDFIPLEYIRNIGDFGISLSSNGAGQKISYQTKEPYTAQISRSMPTAFIFLIDQSGSMSELTTMDGNNIRKSEAVARIVNDQINELVLRCVKTDETRHYYDIAVIGYGSAVNYAWHGTLQGNDFVSPKELQDNPYKKIIVREEKRNRKGVSIKEVEHIQWVEPINSGMTHMYGALKKAKDLLGRWIETHAKQDCYPPTVINITDGIVNDANEDDMMQISNEIKSMSTNDGNVIFFNVHISGSGDNSVQFPGSKDEIPSRDKYAQLLYNMSSLLPFRYNDTIGMYKGEINSNTRHKAMALNAGMSALVQIMDIGTPTNINQNK